MGTVHTIAVHFRYDRCMRRLVNEFLGRTPFYSATDDNKFTSFCHCQSTKKNKYQQHQYSQNQRTKLRLKQNFVEVNPEIVFSGFRLAAPYSAVLWFIQPKFGSAANLGGRFAGVRLYN